MNSAFPNKKISLDLLPRLTHGRNRAPVCRTQGEAPEDSSDDDDDDDILIAFDAPHVPVPLPAVEPERPFLCRSTRLHKGHHSNPYRQLRTTATQSLC